MIVPRGVESLIMLKPHAQPLDSEAVGFTRMFAPERMTLGVFFPIEAFSGDQPTMRDQERLAARAEALGFAAVWVRDVPLRDPSFGDVGQVYDPWVYLGWIAAHTHSIALASGSLILPLRHPLHTAKAAASIDQLSGGRFVMGVATGDRPVEFPAFGVNPQKRDWLFRENLQFIRDVLEEPFPQIQSAYGTLYGTADLVPKPIGWLPMLVTGHSGQSLEWIATHSDGWITYPRPVEQQAKLAARWRAAVAAHAPGQFKPFVQSFYVDLSDNPDEPPQPIHLGVRGGRNVVRRILAQLHAAGVHHVILNLKYGARQASEVLDEIGLEILPAITDSSRRAHQPSSPQPETTTSRDSP